MDEKKITKLCENLVTLIDKEALSSNDLNVVAVVLNKVFKDHQSKMPEPSQVVKIAANIIADFTGDERPEFKDDLLIGQLLLREKLATEEQVERALSKQYRLRKTNENKLLGQILVEDGVMTGKQLNKFLYEYYAQ